MGVNCPQSSPRNASPPWPSFWKMRALPNWSGKRPSWLWEAAELVVLRVREHVAHGYIALLRLVGHGGAGPPVEGIGLEDRHAGELGEEELLGLVDADLAVEVLAESRPDAGGAELLARQVVEGHVLAEQEARLVVLGRRSVAEGPLEVGDEVADADPRRDGLLGVDLPHERVLARRIGHEDHADRLHPAVGPHDRGGIVPRLLPRRHVHDAELDGLLVDLGVRPREIDVVGALEEGHDPFLLDQGRRAVIELDLDALAHRQCRELHPRLGGPPRDEHHHRREHGPSQPSSAVHRFLLSCKRRVLRFVRRGAASAVPATM